MIEATSQKAFVMWQNDPKDGVPEPAILIERYSGTISVTQEGRSVIINDESIEELCRHLRKLLKEKP